MADGYHTVRLAEADSDDGADAYAATFRARTDYNDYSCRCI